MVSMRIRDAGGAPTIDDSAMDDSAGDCRVIDADHWYIWCDTRHKTDDPWGAYLNSDGKHVDQGGTKWVDVSHGNWQDYNAHGVPDATQHGTPVVTTTHLSAGPDGNTSLSFIGSVGVGGGQGNSDCIFGSCDDHDTFGISGHGHYGPGNGEDIGNLWNPATQHGTQGGMTVAKELAVPPPMDSAAAATATEKSVRPSMGHYYLCGPAMILGALGATAEVGVEVLGEEGRDRWMESFKARSGAAAGAVTPVGQYILGRHVFGPAEAATA